MPATEQTWRDLRVLHWVFGASGFVLLGATILMFYVDHDREWKQYQDTFRNVDLTYNEWLQLQFRTDEAVRMHETLAAELLSAQAGEASPELLERFAEIAAADEGAKRRTERIKISERLKALTAAVAAVGEAKDEKAKVAAQTRAAKLRAELIGELDGVVTEIRFRETNKLDERKGLSGELDAAKATLDLAIRDNLPTQRELQEGVDKLKSRLDALTAEYQHLADVRKHLLAVVKELTAAQDDVVKRADANQADLRNLQTAFVDRSMNYFSGKFPYLGKKWLTLPVLDAFNSPRKIENLWSDDLTIYNNFKHVRRFDRCTTCHQAMEKTVPGQPDKGMFEEERVIRLTLETPAAEAVSAARSEFKEQTSTTLSEDEWLLLRLYGFRIAASGLSSDSDATVANVVPGTFAAQATLAETGPAKLDGDALKSSLAQVSGQLPGSRGSLSERPGLILGDVIQQIGGDTTDRPEKVFRQLLASAEFGKPVELVVRRGFAQPYSSHPRLDLFVGSGSPHKAATFACTICHEGQGSATQFKWASHSPDSVRQGEEWTRDHGWFDNGHWIFPMPSKRFMESTCLKCHHDVVDLKPSQRFPDPPAPKVTHGYDLLRKYGCYGCHEINGYDGPAKRIGPDLRIEPNFFAAAQQLRAVLKADGGEAWNGLNTDERRWIDQVAGHPEDDSARRRIVEMLTDDAKQPTPRFSPVAHKLAGALKDVETPGDLRKPGPSLRHAASKLDDEFMYDWIRAPKHFRPNSRMPQFFGFRQHLSDDRSQKMADEFEPVEIVGMLTFLRNRSQEFQFLEKPKVQEPTGSDEELAAARVARGKVQFEQRGCLACHEHGDFAETKKYRAAGEIVQGPDLTGIGTKFDPRRNKRGADWLYSWIKQPTRYHSRTVMPDLFLDPIVKKDAEGKVESVTDPAADIVAYLLQSTNPNWQPEAGAIAAGKGAGLDRLVRENLEEAFFKEAAAKYSEQGIPEEMRRELKGPEQELIVAKDRQGQPLSEEQKLMYIGAKSINKYGCFGCHDIPGFEDAKPIGTGLADWGRKDPAKLAFEHITHYLDHHGGDHAAHGKDEAHETHSIEPAREETPDFYLEHIRSGHREGFIWQKLAEPRSYDFMKTENKRYNEWLRMPKFPFDGEDREALMTFVLGLVAEPPSTKYLYRPGERDQALIEGRKVLDKFNCAGCHLLEPEKWKVSAMNEEIGEQPVPTLYPFLTPHFSSEQIKASEKVDSRGLHTTYLTGMPAIDDATALPRVSDDEQLPVESSDQYDPEKVLYPFDLWEPAVFAGRTYRAGVLPVNVPAKRIDHRFPAFGGMLARYLLPEVTKAEKLVNPAAKGSESWAWVPPPLVGQGRKAQSQWMHDFLLNPFPIRPAVVLRMPKFNLTSAEATALARYFAAFDNVAYPMEPIERRLPGYIAEQEGQYAASAPEGSAPSNRLEDALKIVVNQNYCVKCHLVGDFEPKGGDRAKAPNLAKVHDRLRPGYLREWIANPKQILPYTAMPLNVPYVPDDAKFKGGVDQKLFHGTSLEQVDGLVDLLMNFDNFSKTKTRIAPLVPKDAPKPEVTPTSEAPKPTE